MYFVNVDMAHFYIIAIYPKQTVWITCFPEEVSQLKGDLKKANDEADAMKTKLEGTLHVIYIRTCGHFVKKTLIILSRCDVIWTNHIGQSTDTVIFVIATIF